jgi:hypothetical protein
MRGVDTWTLRRWAASEKITQMRRDAATAVLAERDKSGSDAQPYPLERIEPGVYRYGPWNIRGIERRLDGRQGSRVNYWIAERDGGNYRSEASTLAGLMLVLR